MAALKHGAYSDRVISTVAAEVRAEFLELVRTSVGGCSTKTQWRVPRGSSVRHEWGALRTPLLE